MYLLDPSGGGGPTPCSVAGCSSPAERMCMSIIGDDAGSFGTCDALVCSVHCTTVDTIVGPGHFCPDHPPATRFDLGSIARLLGDG